MSFIKAIEPINWSLIFYTPKLFNGSAIQNFPNYILLNKSVDFNSKSLISFGKIFIYKNSKV